MIVRQAAIAIENAKIYRQLNYLTVTDPLTNMYNFRYFVQKLDYEIERLKRYAGSLCLLIVDIDNFKFYNDEFGHLEGDHLLREIGEVFHKNLRKIDVACRYAGDEFVVILPETKVPEAKIVAQKIKDTFQNLKLKKQVTLSIGGAQYYKEMDRNDLVRKADAALYQAKRKGKNEVCIYE